MPETRRRPWSFQRLGKDQQQIRRPKFRVFSRVKGSKLLDFHAYKTQMKVWIPVLAMRQ